MVISGRVSSHMSFHKSAHARGLAPKAALKLRQFSFQSATSLCPMTQSPCSSMQSASKMRLAATMLMNEGQRRTLVCVVLHVKCSFFGSRANLAPKFADSTNTLSVCITNARDCLFHVLPFCVIVRVVADSKCADLDTNGAP